MFVSRLAEGTRDWETRDRIRRIENKCRASQQKTPNVLHTIQKLYICFKIATYISSILFTCKKSYIGFKRFPYVPKTLDTFQTCYVHCKRSACMSNLVFSVKVLDENVLSNRSSAPMMNIRRVCAR